MSRKPAGGLARSSAPFANGSSTPSDDICPVCKTIRYLNKDMEFLINPECYHPMCSGCVNRLFNDGPNQCPYAGCHKTLRRRGFRSAFFGDLAVEREVDIRRRVAAVFNQREDDFETLRAFNDHLDWVEDLTFKLVGGADADRRAAEATLLEWEAQHRAEIERNKRAGREADEATGRRLAAEAEAARLRRLEALKEDEAERAGRARLRDEVQDAMARGSAGAAGRIMSGIILKKRGQHRLEQAEATLRSAAGGDTAAAAGPGLTIRGLKEKKKKDQGRPADEGPYDPFGGLDRPPGRYALRADYRNPWVEGVRRRDDHRTGGWSADEYFTRAMFEAFAGLGVFIADETETGAGTDAAEVATLGASAAVKREPGAVVKMEVDE